MTMKKNCLIKNMNGFILGGNTSHGGCVRMGIKKMATYFVTKEQLKVASTEPDVMATMHKKQKQR